MGKITHFGITGFLWFALFSATVAQTPLSGAPGAYSRLGSDGFASSTGNAVVAMPGLYSSGFENPALPGYNRQSLFYASTFSLGLERQLFSSYGMNPIGPTGAVSYGIQYFSSGDIDARNNNGEKQDAISTKEITGLFGFSMALKNTPIVVGVNLKYRYANLYTEIPSTSSFGIDAGFLWTTKIPNLLVGGSVQDINAEYRWDTKDIYNEEANSTIDYFPIRYRLGLSYRIEPISAIFSVEGEHWTYKTERREFYYSDPPFSTLQIKKVPKQKNSGNYLRLGGIWEATDALSFRAGVDRIDLTYENSDPKIGVGFRFSHHFGKLSPLIDFSYLFEPNGPQNIWVISTGFTY
ncbi:MAG: hypothetical protein J0L62_04310 [Bacteroidetes bacterium]|nr:hypothetical protein [Bacteroidota bacterium]